MNKPPGYYRDERGREYYWDGQHRSYIPDRNPLSDLNEGFESLVITFFPALMVIMLLLIWFFFALIVGPAGGFLVAVLFGLVAAWVWYSL